MGTKRQLEKVAANLDDISLTLEEQLRQLPNQRHARYCARPWWKMMEGVALQALGVVRSVRL